MWEQLKYTNNTGTVIGSTPSTPVPVAGDTMGFSVIGNLLTTYLKHSGSWSTVLSQTDNTWNNAGHIVMYSHDGAAGTATFDNFGGGTFIPPPSADTFVEGLGFSARIF